ncbi:glutathione s-transferase [Pyrenophora seminiperda CCB06]|uniref:Glutathione s-transferase n=1 Tax=Pyrenophora seminiperda CCB06 TaxID=1302712 RepID=A0A3M7MCM9_9PLEO|nr:glutathione s-transferase [Pyrenophora seminiperda CCB06]
MPRPDLEFLGIGYRRIPVISIGKDVYCDTHLIFSKLETLYPNSTLTPPTPSGAGIRKLFESWTADGGIFANAVKMMPYWQEEGFLTNEKIIVDRQKLMGRKFTPEIMEAGRPDAAQHLRQAFDMLECTFLADGRDWILDTKEPSLADIDAIWPFVWLMVDPRMKDSLPIKHFNADKYPKVFAWVERFVAEVERKKKELGKTTVLDSNSMGQRILGTASSPEHVSFIDDDMLGLKQGDDVKVFPSDYGQMGKTVGAIVGLTADEVVIRSSQGVFMHFPRWNYTIKKVPSKSMI